MGKREKRPAVMEMRAKEEKVTRAGVRCVSVLQEVRPSSADVLFHLGMPEAMLIVI
jgi:hypothetical protein